MSKNRIRQGILNYFKIPEKSKRIVWLWDRINHAFWVGFPLAVGLWQNPGAILFILIILAIMAVYFTERLIK